MPDREKVIKGLECLADVHDENCIGCGYIGIGIYPVCVRTVARDALALLKEQQDEIETLKQTCQSMMEGIVVTSSNKKRIPHLPSSNVQWT